MEKNRAWGRLAAGAAALAMMAAVLSAASPRAAAQESMAKEAGSIPAGETFAVIPLKHVKSDRGGNDVCTALRNVLSRARIYYVSSRYAVAIRGTQADVDAARTMLADLDTPHPAYKLLYTITEKDGAKAVSTRRIELALDARGHAEMKQGDRIPIVTGSTDAQSTAKSQVQYIDVGLMISAVMDGARLRSKVTETHLSESKSGMGASDPVLNQTALDGETPLEPGKAMTLGTMDMPNSTRQIMVTVTAEPAE